LDRKEKHIIEGIRSGSESAYKLLFELYYQKLVVFSKKYLGDLDAARDVVQEFFLYLYESRQSVVIQTSLKSYMYSSVKNRSLNQLKRETLQAQHRKMTLHTDDGKGPDLNEAMDATELEARIFKIVSGLPEKCRQIYIMSRVDGKRNLEIAEELKLSIRTVETQISKALKVLRNRLLSKDG
jgi:RNA polymerase sigma-70 factor (ECF subfamily)